MHHDIKYEGTQSDNDLKAIRDMKDFLGTEQWGKVLVVATGIIGGSGTDAEKMEYLHFAMSFSGVQGYPVNALARHICKILVTQDITEVDNEMASNEVEGSGDQVSS